MVKNESLPPPSSAGAIELGRERVAQRRWLAAIIGFFALQALLWTCAIWLTSGDPSFAIHPNYEARAERWDETRAAAAASRQLGWQVAVEAPAERTAASSPLLFKVCDVQGTPVAGARWTVSMFHQARAAEVQRLEVVETAPGVYSAAAILDRPGRWRLVGQIERGSDILVVNQTVVL